MRIILAIFAAVSAWAQPDCTFQVIAGPPSTSSGDGGPATSAYLLQPNGISLDASGNLYIADSQNHRIRMVNSGGIIQTIAGTGVAGDSGDGGSATAAQLSAPQGVLATPDGSLYVSDTGNHRIRQITPDGIIHAFAGGHSGFSGDGASALAAELSSPVGLALGPDGSIYIADTANNRIRRVDPTGNINTVVGSQNGVPLGTQCFAPDPNCDSGDGGPAIDARLNGPRGIAVGADGTIYIADTNNRLIRRVDPAGTITTIAGTSNIPAYITFPEPALQAFLGQPNNVLLFEDGSLLIATSEGALRLSEGTVDVYTFGLLNGTSNLTAAAGPKGSVYLADSTNNVVLETTGFQAIPQVYAGQIYAALGVEGGPATAPGLSSPQGMAFGADSSVYVADTRNHRVRKISPDGTIRTIAGNGTIGYSGDGGAATSASLNYPTGVAVDSTGIVYVADSGNRAIRMVALDGTISTFASALGEGGIFLSNVGQVPRAIVVHPSGDIYVWMDSIDSYPIVARISGKTVTDFLNLAFLYSRFGATPPAFAGLQVDSRGNLIVQGLQGVILTVDTTGTILSSAVPAGVTATNVPFAFSMAPSGTIFLATGGNYALTPAGVLSMTGFTIDQVNSGSATIYNRDLSHFTGVAASMPGVPSTNAASLATDAAGNLYVADRDLHRIRMLPAGNCSGVPGPVTQAPLDSATLDAALTTNEPMAPGEFVTFKGSGMGPATGVGPVLDPDTGLVPTSLAGTQVLFDGIPGPVFYTSSTQVNAIVPFTIYGRASTKVQVLYNDVASDATIVPLADTVPAVFSNGPRNPSVFNSDSTVNSVTNPAKPGSFVIFYMSGLGRTNPPGMDGHPATVPLPAPLIPLTTMPPFSILYAGDAYSFAEGVIQVNLQLPFAFGGSGAVTVPLAAGFGSTGVVVYIQ